MRQTASRAFELQRLELLVNKGANILLARKVKRSLSLGPQRQQALTVVQEMRAGLIKIVQPAIRTDKACTALHPDMGHTNRPFLNPFPDDGNLCPKGVSVGISLALHELELVHLCKEHLPHFGEQGIDVTNLLTGESLHIPLLHREGCGHQYSKNRQERGNNEQESFHGFEERNAPYSNSPATEKEAKRVGIINA